MGLRLRITETVKQSSANNDDGMRSCGRTRTGSSAPFHENDYIWDRDPFAELTVPSLFSCRIERAQLFISERARVAPAYEAMHAVILKAQYLNLKSWNECSLNPGSPEAQIPH